MVDSPCRASAGPSHGYRGWPRTRTPGRSCRPPSRRWAAKTCGRFSIRERGVCGCRRADLQSGDGLAGPRITTYTRTIDYEARSSREEYGFTTQGAGAGGPLGGGNAPVITTPIVGEQQRNWSSSENFAWNVDGTNVAPQPALGETRQLGDLADAARLSQGGAGAGSQSDRDRAQRTGQGPHQGGLVRGARQIRVQCSINDKNLVERVQTWLPNPVVGDLYHEIVYTNYRDFGGVMLPSNFHAHHDPR